MSGRDGQQAIVEHAIHNGQRQEWAGGLEQLKPGMPAPGLFAGASRTAARSTACHHASLSSGTHTAIANGNTSSRTSA